jgi:hypothetical protein
MLAVSVEWPGLAARVFARLDSLAATAAGEEEVQLLVRLSLLQNSFLPLTYCSVCGAL